MHKYAYLNKAALALRFHGYRGCMPVMEGDLPIKIKSVLGLDADKMVESPDTIMTACADTFSKFHDPAHGAITRVGAGPTTVDFDMPELMRDLASLAQEKGGLIHTHLYPRPGERERCLALYGMTPHRYLESIPPLGGHAACRNVNARILIYVEKPPSWAASLLAVEAGPDRLPQRAASCSPIGDGLCCARRAGSGSADKSLYSLSRAAVAARRRGSNKNRPRIKLAAPWMTLKGMPLMRYARAPPGPKRT